MDWPRADSLCMAPLAAALQNGRATVDQYLDNLVAHVTAGGLEHRDDRPGSRSRADLTALTTSDAVCGAFRVWTFNAAYPRLRPDDAAQLKPALLAVWKAGDVSGWKQSSNTTALDPASPPLLQIFVAIAFRRQLDEPLGRALALAVRPPDETIFDLMNLESLSGEYKSLAVWDRLLRARWIHPPTASTPPRAAASRRAGWTSIIERGLTAGSAGTTAELASFLRALRDHAIVPTTETLYGLLRRGVVPPDRLAVFCDVFPARRLRPPKATATYPAKPEWSSPNGLLLAAALAPQPEADRCAVLEALLRQGLDPNWMPRPSRPEPTTLRGIDFRVDMDAWYARQEWRDQRETALHVAAARGEVVLARLLVRHGAKAGTRDGQGLTTRERAGTEVSRDMDEVLQAGSKTDWFGFRV